MKKALVLLNMGGPNNLDDVEVFLHNMFNDQNIITVKSNLLRSCIAFMIVKSRKKEATNNYKRIGGKSPIVGYTKKLVEKLQKLYDDTYVTFSMRYTPPFSKDVIADIKAKGIKEITLLPMYPQYSTTTTKSSLEEFEKNLKGYAVKVTSLNRFYTNKIYNELLIDKIMEKLGSKTPSEFELIFSAHSLPQNIVNNGDTYEQEVTLHVEILKEMLESKNINFKNIHLAYQSKVGPVKWLEPSLEKKLKSLTCKKVIISPISFTIDNSETEFELDIEYREVSNELGFEEYLVAKCPNDSEKFIEAISKLVTNLK